MPTTLAPSPAIEAPTRQRICVQGIVQGVGFRPFVYSLAQNAGLAGFVRNDSRGVTIEVQGSPAALAEFEGILRQHPPPLARIDALSVQAIPPRHETAFVITPSASSSQRQTLIAPDVATCPDCLRELLDPADRRFGYPFINCTNCGPRFTIVQDVPYDRHNTTMRSFALCPACRAEYDDPADRRFHAQPNACPACGPRVGIRYQVSGIGEELSVSSEQTIQQAAGWLAAGQVVAVKGLGGYHLACDALNPAAVAALRQRKQREAKPFALMAPDVATVEGICAVSPAEAALLRSRRRPIVLLAQRPAATSAAASALPPESLQAIAPGVETLGVMLPYTPLHTLLLHEFTQQVEQRMGPKRPALLVMTSGNRSDEPIAYRDGDAEARLAEIADGWLLHDRPIHMRCDDSVARVVAGEEQILRRARGYAPEPIRLARPFPVPILAVGGHLKNTFCLGKGAQAFLSHHIGDLENLETLTSFREGIEHFQRLFDVTPQAVAHDLHPDYLATQHALALGLPHTISVQHHHAHMASVLAEHGLTGPVIGVAADGSGYGTDGAVWGCEVLAADLRDFRRLGHLAYVPLPGGAQAIRQPWRMAAAYLQQSFGDDFLALEIPFMQALDRQKWRPLAQMIQRGLNSPPTSSLGRLFDAVAALLGVGPIPQAVIQYEGQAAVELERLASSAPAPDAGPYPFAFRGTDDSQPWQMDVLPALRAIVADVQRSVPPAQIGRLFHATVAHLLTAACVQARQQTGLTDVALSGGVFQNRLLLEQMLALLAEQNFRVFINRRVPPNDGGLSLGQAAVAAEQLSSIEC